VLDEHFDLFVSDWPDWGEVVGQKLLRLSGYSGAIGGRDS